MLMQQVVGQESTKKDLTTMWQNDQLPHAILFLGAEGTGGLPLALAFAQYLFCTDKTGSDACGVCSDCKKAAKLEHPDLHISFPAFKPKPNTPALSRYYIQPFREFISQSPYGTTYDWLQFIGAENKQGNIPAEECREIIETLNLKSYEGGRKVQIIWRPEYLGKEGNILLKLIEEPPAGTHLLLVAENTEEILPTILSRTQSVRLTPLKTAEIAKALVNRGVADEKSAAQVANIAQGSYTAALQLAQHSENDLFPDVRRWFNALFTNNGLEISKLASDWSGKGREQQKNFLNYVIRLLEETIRFRFLPQLEPALPADESNFVRKLSTHPLSIEALEQLTREIAKCEYLIERNSHPKTQLHALSIRMQYIIREIPIPAF